MSRIVQLFVFLVFNGEDHTIGFAEIAEFRLDGIPFASLFMLLEVCYLTFSAAITNLET